MKTQKYKNRSLIDGGSEFEKNIGYSRVVVSGTQVYVSGTTGFDYETMSISEKPEQQADQCLKNISMALEAAGTTLDQCVRVHYILPKREYFEPCWPVLRRYFAAARPAATMFVADLIDDRMKIEIEVTAELES